MATTGEDDRQRGQTTGGVRQSRRRHTVSVALQVQQRPHSEVQGEMLRRNCRKEELRQAETRTNVDRALGNLYQLLQVQQRAHPEVPADLQSNDAGSQ